METKGIAPISWGKVIEKATEEVLEGLPSDVLVDPEYVRDKVISEVNREVELWNAVLPKERKFKYITALLPVQIATSIKKSKIVVKIACAGKGEDKDNDVLAVYQESGEER